MRIGLTLLAGLIAAPAAAQEAPAEAPAPPTQRSAENAVTQAKDAFGTNIGRESIGLYGSGSIRGFSPTAAQNVRIEGMYFDQRASITSRIQAGSTVRVGLAAQTDPFPAPTGIVDYALRRSGPGAALSTLGSFGPYEGYGAELDGQLGTADGRLSAAVGISAARDRFANGGSGRYLAWGLVPRWQPREGVEVIGLWGRSNAYDETALPIFIPAAGQLPPRIRRGIYPGPDWATYSGVADTAGLIGRAELGGWSIAAAGFRSLSRSSKGASLILDRVDEARTAERQVFIDPPSRFRSWSGEARVSRTFSEGARKHLLLASYRTRRVASRFGGSDFLAFPRDPVGETIDPPRPALGFGEQTRDGIAQTNLGLSYGLQWGEALELRLGVQRAGYRKRVARPGEPVSRLSQQEWLPNATASVRINERLSAYGSYVEGLEENGQAPDFAINRLQILPALRTRQYDFGIRWAPADDTVVVLGWFDIRKPYFNLDQARAFRQLGAQRHSGVEASIATDLGPDLRLVGGAVIQNPRVAAAADAAFPVGNRPVAQSRVVAQLSADYQLQALPGVSLDGTLSYRSRQAADVRNTVFVGAYATLSLGARYRFKLGDAPAVFRVSLSNVSNEFTWLPLGSGAFEPLNQRTVRAYLTVDF